VAILAAVAAAAWRLTQPVPLGVVNNSHPLHLFVGTTWLAIALANTEALGRLANSRMAGGAIRAISRRSLTIYLWHTGAIILAVNILDVGGVHGPFGHAAGLVLLTALGTFVAVQLVGWIEDVAAGRPRPVSEPLRSRGLHRPSLVLATVVSLVAGAALAVPGKKGATSSAAASSRRPPVPSQAPAPPTFGLEDAPTRGTPRPGPVSAAAAPGLNAKLDGLLAPWAQAAGVSGALVGVSGRGLGWSGAIGRRPNLERGRRVGIRAL